MTLQRYKYALYGIIFLIFIGLPLLLRSLNWHNSTFYSEKISKWKDPVTQQETFVSNARPKKVILMIGDGMGITQISAAEIIKRDNLILRKFQHIGLMTVHSTKLITDSAASATAMATGHKTRNGLIAMSPKLDTLKTIMEYAKEGGWASGIVTTAPVTHATPASFYAHQPTRAKVADKIAAQWMETDMEVLMGGGWAYFRKGVNGRNLIKEAEDAGYFVTDDVSKVGEYIPKRLLCLVAERLPKSVDKRGDFLPKGTKKALEVLDYSKKPFFLMVEGGQIDWGGHNNDSDHIVNEMLDFDKAIEQALAYAEKDGNTLLIVTGDHETGGYSINGGDRKEGKLETEFTSTYHTADMIPVFAYGPGAASFTGTYDNTEIFLKLKQLMGM